MATSAQIDQAILAYEYDLELQVSMELSLAEREQPVDYTRPFRCCGGDVFDGHRSHCGYHQDGNA